MVTTPDAPRLDPCCAIVDFRQYTCRPGQRDTLIELFDREFIETQEALGIHQVGQFRDLDRPDYFVWMRGFTDNAARGEALAAFYGGPDWKAHARAANATMIDSDDVLMLRPVYLRDGYPTPNAPRAGEQSLITATIYYVAGDLDAFARRLEPFPGAIACFQTETAPNTFPALPVREDDRVVVWLTRSPEPPPAVLAADLYRAPQVLRLAPSARSQLR
jgi:hypothetical protein